MAHQENNRITRLITPINKSITDPDDLDADIVYFF